LSPKAHSEPNSDERAGADKHDCRPVLGEARKDAFAERRRLGVRVTLVRESRRRLRHYRQDSKTGSGGHTSAYVLESAG
jgi:hypothetical protein